jgi:hypothetical protein
MFADAGTKPPPGMGTTTPEKVGQAVVSAIERNRSEIAVAPIRLRVLAGWASRHPEWAGRLTRRESTHRMGDELAAGQADKR